MAKKLIRREVAAPIAQAPAADAPPPEPRIVAASMTAAGTLDKNRRELAQQIEAAMSQAVTDALAAGVDTYDTAEILTRKEAARQRVLDASALA